MVLATYNIHRCIGRDGLSAARIAQVLRELRADVIALQEVESRRDGGLNLVDHFAEVTDMTGIAGPTLLNETAHYGNALLTRYPVRAFAHVDLSVPGREPRGALDVRLSGPGDRILRVVATHFGLRPSERRFQAQRLLARLAEKNADISVLMGDLNEWFLWGRPLRRLRRHFSRTPAPATFPARFPLFALDRIWVQPRARLRSLGIHRTRLSRAASDHFPLRATVDV